MKARPEGPTAINHMLALVRRTPEGIGSRAVAIACRVSNDTASSSLSRLFWRGLVDRHMEGTAFVYTPLLARLR